MLRTIDRYEHTTDDTARCGVVNELPSDIDTTTTAGATYMRYSKGDTCAITKVTDSGAGWTWGAWASRATLSYNTPCCELLTVEG